MSPSLLKTSDPALSRICAPPSRRRARGIVWAVLAVLSLAAPAALGQEVFASRGASAAAAAAQSFNRQPEEYRQKAQGCVPVLNQALSIEDQMNAMIARSNTQEFQIDNRKRADLLNQFGTCVADSETGRSVLRGGADVKVLRAPDNPVSSDPFRSTDPSSSSHPPYQSGANRSGTQTTGRAQKSATQPKAKAEAPITDTAVTHVGWGLGKNYELWPVSARIPRNLPAGATRDVELDRSHAADSPWFTASITVIQPKTAHNKGTVVFNTVSDRSGTVHNVRGGRVDY